MGLPQWYLPDESPITLPRVARPLTNPYIIEDDDIELTTGRGVIINYKQFSRRTPVYLFRIPASQLQAFITLHETVQGRTIPFYFVPNVDASPLDAMLVRKEKGFNPVSIGKFAFNGVYEQWFDYELRLTEEITAASIEE